MNRSLVALELKEAFLLNPSGDTVADTYANPATLINSLLPNVFTIAGLLMFAFLVGAGFKMVMNPESKKGVEEGKKSVTYAIGGFVLLFVAYWIIQIIQYVTGVPILG